MAELYCSLSSAQRESAGKTQRGPLSTDFVLTDFVSQNDFSEANRGLAHRYSLA
jgi:hypothetical protein